MKIRFEKWPSQEICFLCHFNTIDISFPLETNDQDYYIQCSAQLEGGTGKKDSKCHKITLVDQLTSNLLNVKYVSYSWLFRYIGIVSIEILIFGCILFCLWR